MSNSALTMQILDQPQRKAAQNPNNSCIVQAPAGSGKTTLLAQRYVRLLATVTQPEQILAITFTKKAAAEMRERVLEELADSESSMGRAALSHAEAQGWQIQKYPGRLRIQTIDSFAMNLVKQLPVTSPLQQRNICAHPDNYYQQAVARVLRRVQEPKKTGAGLLAGELLGNFMNDNVQVHNLLVTMLRRREQWQFMLLDRLRQTRQSNSNVGLIDTIAYAIQGLQTDALADVSQLISKPLQVKLQRLAAYAADNLPQQVAFDTLNEFDRWRFIADNLLLTASSAVGKPQLRKQVTKNQGFPSIKPNPNKDEMHRLLAEMAEHLELHKPALEGLAALQWLPDTNSVESDRDRLLLIGAVLFECVTELNELFNEQSEVDFNQITIAAISALGSDDAPSDLALSLDYRISHLLIDEFQDTSRAQHELFNRLIREWVPGDGNTFFAVGDPMQSIYRFRNADVSLFLEVCERGMGNLPLQHLRLTTNFRSSDPMISWFNQVFEPLLGDRNEPNLGAISYASATSPRQQLTALGQKDVLAPLRLSLTVAEQNEQIVAQVKALNESAEFSDIAILLRNRSPAGELVRALEGAGIPWQGTDLHALGNMAIVSDAACLAQSLFDPGNRVSSFALLRGPLVGMTLADMQRLSEVMAAAEPKENGDPRVLPASHSAIFDWPVETLEGKVSQDGILRLKRLQAIAQPLLGRRLTLAPRELIESLWLQLGGPAAYPESTHKHIARLLDVIETGHPSRFDPERLDRDISQLYAEDDSNGVQILTVHKSKGLQYKHVLVPYLQARTRADEAALLMSREASKGFLMAARLPGTADPDKKRRTLYHWLKLEEQQRARNEVKRLFYVAATRAEQSLTLFGTLKDNKPPEANSLLGAMAPVFGECWRDLSPAHESSNKGLSEPVADPVDLSIRVLPARLATPTLPPPNVQLPRRARGSTTHRGGSELDDPELLFSAERRAAILRGNLIHQALCTLSRDERLNVAAYPTPVSETHEETIPKAQKVIEAAADLIERERSYWHKQAREIGLDEALAANVVTETEQGLRQIADSPVGRWCALEPHRESQSELPLTLWENSGPVKLVIDRTFLASHDPNSIDRENLAKRWIIDYKTSQPPLSDAARASWLSAELDRYRSQLAGYARALAALHPRQSSVTALYFTATDELWEVALPGGVVTADRQIHVAFDTSR